MEEQQNKKKSLKEWIAEDVRKDLRCWRGTLVGLFVGYMISYAFQPELIRVKLGFFGYLSHIGDILFTFDDKMFAQVALTAWISMLIGARIGSYVEGKLNEKGKACAREEKDEA